VVSEALLSLTGVKHRYADEADWELDVPAFQVRTAEVVGILGPNGSGKSTLLRIASGALRPRGGTVTLEQRDLSRVDRRWVDRRLGYLPQAAQSQFDYTVEEVVAMGRYAHQAGLGLLGERDRGAVARSLKATETERFRARRLSHLSGGERQRVFLASVLAQEPRLLLLDEPTRFLDIHHQVGFFRLLAELAGKGIGVGVVTHDVNLAALYCHRLFVLQAGAAVAEGPPAQVLRREVIGALYGPEVVMGRHPESGRAIVVPADLQEGEGGG
jgi:iron complex transport system ATP-binding protein